VEFDEYLLALRKRWLVIAALGLLGALGGWLYAQTIPATFRSTASVFVSLNEGGSAGELVQGSNFIQNSVTSFGRLASMPVVLDPVIDQLGLDTTAKALGNRVKANNPLNTVILEISTTDTDPARAADISNAVARQLSRTVQDLSPQIDSGASAILVSVIAPAVEPTVPFQPNTRFLIATGLILGILAGVAVDLLMTLVDTRIRTRADLERVSGLPVLSDIVRVKSPAMVYRTVYGDPRSPRAESFRRLQTTLQYLTTTQEIRSIVVTSSIAGEGKTSTAVNLAAAVAEKGAKVLVIDADLRRPAIARAIGIEGSIGLTTALIGQAGLDDVVQSWGPANLAVLPAGDTPPNPSQLLDSEMMRDLLATATTSYDLVILDSPPLLPVIDAAILGRHADGVLLVTRLRSTRRQQVRASLASLQQIGATCLGLVATNGVDDGTGTGHTYAYDEKSTQRSWYGARARLRRRDRGQGTSRAMWSPQLLPRKDSTTSGPPAGRSGDTAVVADATETVVAAGIDEPVVTADDDPAVAPSPNGPTEVPPSDEPIPAPTTSAETDDDGTGEDQAPDDAAAGLAEADRENSDQPAR